MHDTAGRGRSSDGRQRLWPYRLRSEFKRLPKISVKAGPRIHVLRMVGKLSHAVSFEPMHFGRLVQLLLDASPILVWPLAAPRSLLVTPGSCPRLSLPLFVFHRPERTAGRHSTPGRRMCAEPGDGHRQALVHQIRLQPCDKAKNRRSRRRRCVSFSRRTRSA